MVMRGRAMGIWWLSAGLEGWLVWQLAPVWLSGRPCSAVCGGVFASSGDDFPGMCGVGSMLGNAAPWPVEYRQ